jgi:hypothetical protein
MELKGKRVVFIAPNFFGYDLAIERALSRQGAEIFRLKDRPFSSSIFKAFTKVFTRLVRRILDYYYLTRLADIPNNFDLVLVINGQTVSRNVLNKLKEKNHNAKFILYMWDSLKNRSTVKDSLDLFDKKFSFEKDNSPLFSFRPLFFEPRVSSVNHKNTYLMSFIGTAHSDRFAIIKKINTAFSSKVCFWYLFLQAKWVFYWYKISRVDFEDAKIHDFNFLPMSGSDWHNVFMRSEIIVDIEHPMQKGLTSRTFEVLGVGKKLVTTNRDVVNYDFYKYGNIYVINRLDPEIPEEFIERKFNPYPSNILNFYSVDGWLGEVLHDV